MEPETRIICDISYPRNGTLNLFSHERRFSTISLAQTFAGRCQTDVCRLLQLPSYLAHQQSARRRPTTGHRRLWNMRTQYDPASQTSDGHVYQYHQPGALLRRAGFRRVVRRPRSVQSACLWLGQNGRGATWPKRRQNHPHAVPHFLGLSQNTRRSLRALESRIPNLFWSGEIKSERGRLPRRGEQVFPSGRRLGCQVDGKQRLHRPEAFERVQSAREVLLLQVSVAPQGPFVLVATEASATVRLAGDLSSDRLLAGIPVSSAAERIEYCSSQREQHWQSVRGDDQLFEGSWGKGERDRSARVAVRSRLLERASHSILLWWKLLYEYAKLFTYPPRIHPYAVHIGELLFNKSALKRTSAQPAAFRRSSSLLFALLVLHRLLWIYIVFPSHTLHSDCCRERVRAPYKADLTYSVNF